MPDIAALVTPPLLLDSTGKPANGEIFLTLSQDISVSGGIATPVTVKGLVTHGQFTALDGQALNVPVTPEGAGVHIFVELREDRPSGSGQVRAKYGIRRTVSVPDQASVTWDELVDVVPIEAGGDYIVPPWAGAVLTAKSEAEAAAVAATDAAADAVAAAASVPSDATIAATYAAKSELTPKLDKTLAAATYAPTARLMRVAYLGDSQVPPLAYTYNGATPHWAAVARATLSHRYDDGICAGIGGQTSTQVAARVGDILAAPPSICIVHCGVNDLAASGTATTIIANLQTIITALISKGIRPVILTMLPSSNINTSAKLAECAKVNVWIKALPATQGVTSIDWRSAVVDYASTAAAWKAGLSTDLIHPNDLGHTVLGRVIAAGLDSIIAGPTPLVSDGGSNPSLLSLNPGMTGSGGVAGTGVTGTVPASWDVSPVGSATAVVAVEPRTDDVGGNWLKLDLTSGAVRLYQQNTGIGTAFSVGDIVWLETEILIENTPTNFRGFQLSLSFWNGLGDVHDYTLTQAPNVSSPLVGSTRRYVLRTKPTAVPAGTGRLQAFLYVYQSVASVNASIKIGRTAIRKLI